MRIVGFNGREIKEGTCNRGKKSAEKEPVPIHAPISFDFIRDTVVCIVASQIESAEKCKGCGNVTKEKPLTLDLRKKRMRRVVEHASGRLIALQEHMDLCVQTFDSCND